MIATSKFKSQIAFVIRSGLLIPYSHYYLLQLLSNTKIKIIHLVNEINLHLSGISYGKELHTYGHLILDIYPKSKVKIGNNVSMISNRKRCTASSLYSSIKIKTFSETSDIIIGDNVGLNGTSITSRSKKIEIGEGTIIAGNVIILDSDFHNPWPPTKRLEFAGPQNDEEVIIGEYCWIGLNCIILKGVNIGANSVIGAGSVVVNDVPPNCMAAGNPARVIKNYMNQ